MWHTVKTVVSTAIQTVKNSKQIVANKRNKVTRNARRWGYAKQKRGSCLFFVFIPKCKLAIKRLHFYFLLSTRLRGSSNQLPKKTRGTNTQANPNRFALKGGSVRYAIRLLERTSAPGVSNEVHARTTSHAVSMSFIARANTKVSDQPMWRLAGWCWCWCVPQRSAFCSSGGSYVTYPWPFLTVALSVYVRSGAGRSPCVCDCFAFFSRFFSRLKVAEIVGMRSKAVCITVLCV